MIIISVSNDSGSGMRALQTRSGAVGGWVAALWHAGTRSGLFARGGNDTGIAPTAGDGEATASSLHVFASREEAEKAFVEAAANVSFSHAGALFAGRRQGPGRSTYRDGCYLDGSWEADRLSAHGVGRVPLQLGHYEGELGFAPNTTSQSRHRQSMLSLTHARA
ncbi:hypothetical protein T492DRAFT_218920 [Pavlovales sp. CCMP2436]|nr:hypothetical protein T492DRAFT_218920 [Pavlovales sp. CCMP2436]